MKVKTAAKRKRTPKPAWLLFWPLGLALAWGTAAIPAVIENFYTLRLAKPAAGALSLASGVFPFSLAEVIMIFLGAGLILGLVRFLFLLLKAILLRIKPSLKKARFRSQPKTGGLLSCLYRIIVLLGIIYFSFIILWGLNYNRLSFAEIAGLELQESSVEELAELSGRLIARANELRLSLPEDSRGVFQLEGGFPTVRALAPKALAKAGEIYPELAGNFGRPKPVFLSKLMSYTGISGIYFPFTGEANVNVDIPESLLPATTCHELAHQRGIAREDEANYIAWVACNLSEEPAFQYSGVQLALIYSMNALYEHAPEKARELQQQYSPQVARDLKYISEYWEKYEGKVEEVASDINDAYLKSNRQEEGVQSYGRMVDLLLTEQKAEARKRMLP
ncbi:MAG: DUF3810 domain-containing protein [Desulfitobacteriia bacterium]|jgi:hypothetical protein